MDHAIFGLLTPRCRTTRPGDASIAGPGLVTVAVRSVVSRRPEPHRREVAVVGVSSVCPLRAPVRQSGPTSAHAADSAACSKAECQDPAIHGDVDARAPAWDRPQQARVRPTDPRTPNYRRREGRAGWGRTGVRPGGSCATAERRADPSPTPSADPTSFIPMVPQHASRVPWVQTRMSRIPDGIA